MIAPACETCRYADPTVVANLDGAGPEAVLICRRYPPAMVEDDGGYGPVWPLVNDSDWCGEHAAKVVS